MTLREYKKTIRELGPATEVQRKKVTCALLGHSRIQDYCFGQYTCARCGTLTGDNLACVYMSAPDVVIVGHNCPTCRENYKKLSWKDKMLCPDPF